MIAPVLLGWTQIAGNLFDGGQQVAVYKTAPHAPAVPFPAPAGWGVLFPPFYGGVAGGDRWYAALRSLTIVTPLAQTPGAPSVGAGWHSLSSPLMDSGQLVWMYRTDPSVPIPVQATPAGWELIAGPTPPTVAGGQRWYVLLRQLLAPPIPQGMPYSVEVSETLFVTSSVSANGILQPRTWTLAGGIEAGNALGQRQTGFNAAFWVPPTTSLATYSLIEADANASSGDASEVEHKVTVLKDPYTTMVLASGGDLSGAVAAAPNLTRIVLPAGSSYTVIHTALTGARLQIVAGGPGVTVNLDQKLAGTGGSYAFWRDANSQLSVQGVTFAGPINPILDGHGKTGLTGFYVPLGSASFLDCTFTRMDQGVQLDSRPTYQPDGVLLKNAVAEVEMYGCPVWGAGRNVVIEGCMLGPSRQEHPLRFSTLNLQTNQTPSFIRIGNSALTAIKQSVSAKECFSLRDCEYVYMENCNGNTWAAIGEGGQAPQNRCQNIVIDNLKLSFDTVHVRMGVTGDVTLSNSVFQAKPVVGVPGPIANHIKLINNKP